MNLSTFIAAAIIVGILILIFKRIRKQGGTCSGCSKSGCSSRKNR